ncbi:hypothetical protein Tco_0960071 [Tanacetum coccineum]
MIYTATKTNIEFDGITIASDGHVSELCSIGGLAPSREIRVPEGFYSATVFLILESFDELVDVFDVYALQTKEVGNMSTNKSRILSQGHGKLKNDLVSLKSKKSLLEHEMSKLEDRLAKAQRNQDELSKELSGLRPRLEEGDRLKQRCQNLERERDFFLTKFEEVSVLTSKLEAASLEKAKFVKDFLPSMVKKLVETRRGVE